MEDKEEKSKAVLAKCARLCPNEGDFTHLMNGTITLKNRGEDGWKFYFKWMDGKFWVKEGSPDVNFNLAHSLLSLGVQSPSNHAQLVLEILNTKPIENIRDMMGEELGGKIMKLLYALHNNDVSEASKKRLYVLGNVPFQDQVDIPAAWLEIWEEVENWYGDIQKRETGPSFLKRLSSKYLVVQYPAPDEKDENGLLPCPFCGGRATLLAQNGVNEGYYDVFCENVCGVKPFQTFLMPKDGIANCPWNTRAHAPIQKPDIDLLKKAFIYGQAVTTPESSDMLFDSFLKTIDAPSAGKDSEIAGLKAQGDEFIAQRNHLLTELRSEREKSAKLIEAVEEIKKVASTEAGLSMDTLIGYIDGRLAAYKGKEAKEGGEE